MLDTTALTLELTQQARYAALVAAGDMDALAHLLNTPVKAALDVPVDVPSERVARALVAAELVGLTAIQRDVIRTLLSAPVITSAQVLELSVFFTSGGVTATRLAALAVRKPTRAELLGYVDFPLDFTHVALALSAYTAALAPPSNPQPTRTFARFVVQKDGRVYLPALATGTLAVDEPFVVSVDGFGDAQELPLQFRTVPTLPAELQAGVTYYVANPSGATFAATDTPGGKELFLSAGTGGLIEFPGYSLRQVRR